MRSFYLIAALLLANSASAAHLVRDINSEPILSGAPAFGWSGVGSYTVFLMDDGIHGQELWRTDGTAQGTQLVRDINPGPASSNAVSLTMLNGVLYFFATDGTNGQELWRSDGTAAGTHIVADINTGANDGGYNPQSSSPIPTLNGVLYFDGTDATTGTELWRSDGTGAGTYRLSGSASAPLNSSPVSLTVTGSRVFYSAGDAAGGVELWSTDGTTAGTRRVADINPGAPGSEPQELTATSAGVFFTADDGTHGRELWFASLDGSSAHLVTDLTPHTPSTQFGQIVPFEADVVVAAVGPQGSSLYRANSAGMQLLASGLPADFYGSAVGGFESYGGRLLFSIRVNSPGAQLWVTDGTSAGTKQLGAATGLVPNSLFGNAPPLSALPGSDGLYFFAFAGAQGSPVNLWRTDGTEAGTVLYAALPQNFVWSDLVQYQGKIFFAAGRFTANGWELWVSDGTAAGTQEFADLNPGAADSNPGNFGVVGARLYFEAAIPSGLAPWVSDGTVAGTVPLYTAGGLRQTGNSSPEFFTPLGSRAVFVADDGVHGRQPWVSDGTAAGTQLLRALSPGPTFALGPFVPLNSLVLFEADDGVHGAELWATDGTPGGTNLIADINPGAASSDPLSAFFSVAVLNGIGYFPADDGVHGRELWRSDGTAAGTWMVADITPGPAGSSVWYAYVLNGQVLFSYTDAVGSLWWTTDGTAAGTHPVTTAVYVSGEAVEMNGMLYFGGQTAPPVNNAQGQLWRTDGSAAGTQQVSNLKPGAQYTTVGAPMALPNYVLFQFCTTDPPAGCTVYSSDGSAANTMQISPDTLTGFDQGLNGGVSAVVGNQVFYVAQSSTQYVLQVSDGTLAGTHDVLSSSLASRDFPGNLTTAFGHLLFTRNDPILGPSAWTSDGTAAGTRLVADTDPGTQNQYVPYGFTAIGNNVFFQAYAPGVGAELYLLDVNAPNAADDFITATPGSPAAIQLHRCGHAGTRLSPCDCLHHHGGARGPCARHRADATATASCPVFRRGWGLGAVGTLDTGVGDGSAGVRYSAATGNRTRL